MMSAPDDTPTTGPYGDHALQYHRAGWSPLPLPPGAKKHPPAGWTGRDGRTPSGPDVHAWTEDHPAGNIALRMPPDVLGIDVDAYDNKPGGLVLTHLEDTHGPLPATWRSTSRDDGTSGIRFYTVPPGLRWPSILGPGIETIRREHRYAVAWPSTHPDHGGTYRWISPDGTTTIGTIPTPGDLPALPDAWVSHFTGGELAPDTTTAGLTTAAATAWLDQAAPGHPCRAVQAAISRAGTDLTTSGGARHDTALRAVHRLVWLAAEGHPGTTAALADVQGAFLAATGGDRAPGEAEAEYARLVTGSIDIAAAHHPAPANGPDPCTDPFAGLIDRSTTPCPSSTPPSPSPTTSPASPTPSSGSSTSTQTPPSTPGSPTSSATTSTTPTTSSGANNSATPEADDAYEERLKQDAYAQQELERLRAQRTAQRLLEAEDEDNVIADRVRRRILDDRALVEYKRITEPPAPPFDAGTLAEILARPDEPPMRADGLIPWSGSALVVAQRKTGKTTLLLNYARALINGETFLGQFPVIPIAPDARVAFLNYEVSAKQLARWADDVGVPDDRLYQVNLRGRRNPLSHPDDREQLAAALREQNVEAVIVDPFGRAYTGASQNDNGEVQAFLVDLDMFVRAEVGANDLLLAAHAGWDGERSRGASALEDWGDTIITLTRDAEEEDRRYMRAMGRDVDVDEDELTMHQATRTLTRSGFGSRKNQRKNSESADLAVKVVQAAREKPGCSKSTLADLIAEDHGVTGLKSGRGASKLSAAISMAERQGQLRVEKGRNGTPNQHFVADPTATLSTENRGLSTASTLSRKAEVVETPLTSENTPTTSTTSAASTQEPGTTSTPLYRGSGSGGGGLRPLAGGSLNYNPETGEVTDA